MSYSSARGLFPHTPPPIPADEHGSTRDGWIQTHSGKKVYPLDFGTCDFDAGDVAHALAHLCRFTGHTSRFYSVAQHCVYVAQLVGAARQTMLAGLLHDASEAYLQDLPTPLKYHTSMQAYRDAEAQVQSAIYWKHGIREEPAAVKRADKRMLATEARDLLAPMHPDFKIPAEPIAQRIECWTSADAKARWLALYAELTGRR